MPFLKRFKNIVGDGGEGRIGPLSEMKGNRGDICIVESGL